VIGAVVGPLYPIAVTLFYYDQRSRKEGFDVEIMMEAAGLETAEPEPSGSSPKKHGLRRSDGASVASDLEVYPQLAGFRLNP